MAATLDEGVRPEAATFVAGDACALPAEYSGAFDAVLALNLLDRVPDPVRVLQQVRAPRCMFWEAGPARLLRGAARAGMCALKECMLGAPI